MEGAGQELRWPPGLLSSHVVVAADIFSTLQRFFWVSDPGADQSRKQ